MAREVDGIDDPRAWRKAALNQCRHAWARMGPRYDQRLNHTDQVRDALDDVLTLTARRMLPLYGTVMRRLPEGGAAGLAAAFNRLDPADRYVLSRLRRLGSPRAARAEHLASALERLLRAAGLGRQSSRGRGPSVVAGAGANCASSAAPESSTESMRTQVPFSLR